MTRALRFLAIAAFSMGIAGCSTHSLETLRHTTATGNAFQTALSQRYMDFANREEKAYDWANSMHFADKGLLSAYGKEVGPEELKDWDIAPANLPDMRQAREALVAALTPDAENAQPEAAAEAQTGFDCWVAYQEHSRQQDNADACRMRLQAALAQLAAEHNAQPASAAPDSTEETISHAGVAQKRSYRVFFAMNSAALSDEGKRIVDGVAQSLKNVHDYDVTLNGHTDTTGAQEFNLKLSEQRGHAVQRRLTEGGVDARAIHIFAFGKSDPLIKTGDGVAEPKNRRVEIFLNQ